MTKLSDLFLMYLTIAGWLFHKGGFRNVWESLGVRVREVVGDRFIAWLNSIERGDR